MAPDCEGVVVVQAGVPDVEHAWCVDGDGGVIDVTLKEPGVSYFGIVFSAEEIATIGGFPVIDHFLEAEAATTEPAASSVSLLLTQAQRKFVALLMDELRDRLKLDEKNQRTISLSSNEIADVARKAEVAIHQTRSGMVRNSLRHVIDACRKASDARQGLGQIPATERLFQFKITLAGSNPPIWRRIQVRNGSLDKLHEHIQTAMGWTNSHLHHFRVGEQMYGDQDLMEETFLELGYEDSTTTKIGDILPKDGKPFAFQYEYDFGDGWRHEVLFEGCVRAEAQGRYPKCLEGQRACPPEDVGGIRGYAEFLEALADRRHERHDEYRNWIGGRFDSEAFDPVKATKRMKRGLPDWRRLSWM